MARENRCDATAKRIHRAYKREDKCKRSEYIHGDPAPPPAIPGALHAGSLGRTCCGSTGASRCCLILGSAFSLNYLGDKSAVRVGVALHQGLGLVYKSIRQRIAADVTDRQGLPFPFQHKINPAGNVVNTTGGDGAADAHALAFRGTRQRRKFGDGVIVRLALSVAEPRQKAHRSYDYADSHAKLCLLLHGSTPTMPSIQPWV